jgi:glycosyltransferase involved in cell wall biosynthesis
LAALRDWEPDVLYCHGLESPELESRLLQIAPAVTFLHCYVGSCITGHKTFQAPETRPCDLSFGAACLLRYYPRRCGGLNPLTMWRLYRTQSKRLGLLRRCGRLVTHSEHMVREYARYGLAVQRVPAYPGSGAGTSGTCQSAAGSVPEGPGSVARLLFVGRMDPLKGGAVLIEALPRVAEGLGRPVHLTLAGDGPARAEWEARAARQQASRGDVRIEFPGWVRRERLGHLFAEHDLLVVPSLWPEPFGLVGLEAGRACLPVAAFAVGGIPDWLSEGVNGALAPGDPPRPSGLADAVVRCLRDPEQCRRLRAGARSRAGEFTMGRHLDYMEGVLARAACGELGHHRAPRACETPPAALPHTLRAGESGDLLGQAGSNGLPPPGGD